jgi:hypothetical protein
VRSHPWFRVSIAASALALVGAAAIPTAAAGAASGARPVRPGTSVTIAGITCTAGPLLRQKRVVYLAVPASCGGLDPGKSQNGCTESNAPVGIPVQVRGARHRSVLVYDSFARMQSIGTKGKRLCDFNDLALVRINRLDLGRVSAAIDGKHAPTGLLTRSPASGRSMTVGSHAATTGASHDGGWESDFMTTASLSATDVGSVAVVGARVFGMLTVLPGSMLSELPISTPVSPPAEVYSLAKALQFLKKAPGFHHVSLLKVGEKV